MTHEIKQLFEVAVLWQQSGKRSVLVTVVHLEGSSYRRPGVRMLLNDHGEEIGAVSGGCVEKEIKRQANSVFQTGEAKMMTYDGRLRLGCEGILYILIEPILITDEFINVFLDAIKRRIPFRTKTYYTSFLESNHELGTQIIIEQRTFDLHPAAKYKGKETPECFEQSFSPLFQLYIFGAEHDAVQLCKAGSQLGWQVTVVADPDESKSLEYFPGAARLITPTFKELDTSIIDNQTAIVLMTHSFNKDIQYLLALKDVYPAYFGLLGPAHRRERILEKFLELQPDIATEFLDQLHGPAGVNIGAESASEIAISILAEILSVVRKQDPIALRHKTGRIHG